MGNVLVYAFLVLRHSLGLYNWAALAEATIAQYFSEIPKTWLQSTQSVVNGIGAWWRTFFSLNWTVRTWKRCSFNRKASLTIETIETHCKPTVPGASFSSKVTSLHHRDLVTWHRWIPFFGAIQRLPKVYANKPTTVVELKNEINSVIGEADLDLTASAPSGRHSNDSGWRCYLKKLSKLDILSSGTWSCSGSFEKKKSKCVWFEYSCLSSGLFSCWFVSIGAPFNWMVLFVMRVQKGSSFELLRAIIAIV